MIWIATFCLLWTLYSYDYPTSWTNKVLDPVVHMLDILVSYDYP